MSKKYFRLLTAVLFILIFFISMQKVEALSPKNKNLSEILDDFFKKREKYSLFSGSVLVAKDNAVLLCSGYGYSNRKQKIKNTPETKYLIASVSKQFTACAIMQLYEKNKLDIDDFIGKYNFNFPYSDKITIRHLLTHTSGYPRNYYIKNHIIPDFSSFIDSTAEKADFELLFMPGTSFNYSNFGYQILARIIELVSGETFQNYMKNHIFGILEMKDSGTNYDALNDQRTAYGYNLTFDDNMPLQQEIFFSSGSGSIVTNILDLYKWDQALYDNKILSENSKKTMFAPYLNNYGFGWNIHKQRFKNNKITIQTHGGNFNRPNGGFTSQILRVPEYKITIIILCNIIDYNEISQWKNDILKKILKFKKNRKLSLIEQ
ncbi:MAG: beta-lactamase family protein [Spirochaetes bacterium]|nr:beta-lactamase family protein [Spirochaetota bacterium]